MQQKQQADVAHLVAGAVEAEEVHQAVVDARWQAESGGQLVASTGGSATAAVAARWAACAGLWLPACNCRRLRPSWLGRLLRNGLIPPAAAALRAHLRRRSRAWQEKQEPKLQRKLPAGRQAGNGSRLQRLVSWLSSDAALCRQPLEGAMHSRSECFVLYCQCSYHYRQQPSRPAAHRRGRQTGRRRSQRCSS